MLFSILADRYMFDGCVVNHVSDSAELFVHVRVFSPMEV